jgi:hypothetical protein
MAKLSQTERGYTIQGYSKGFKNNALTANKCAFSLYFEVATYKNNVQQVTNGTDFDLLLQSMAKTVDKGVCVHRKKWEVDAIATSINCQSIYVFKAGVLRFHFWNGLVRVLQIRKCPP